MFGNKQLNQTKIKKISIVFFIRSLNGSTTTPACSSAKNDEKTLALTKERERTTSGTWKSSHVQTKLKPNFISKTLASPWIN